MTEYSAQQTKLTIALADYKREMSEKIRSLRIIIPDALRETYNYVQNLGKE